MDDKDLTQGAYVKPPSGSYTLWENTMCNPLGDMRTQTQSAWHDGYASAKVEREWVGLTSEELEFYTEELGQGEFGRGVLRAVNEFLLEKNT